MFDGWLDSIKYVSHLLDHDIPDIYQTTRKTIHITSRVVFFFSIGRNLFPKYVSDSLYNE